MRHVILSIALLLALDSCKLAMAGVSLTNLIEFGADRSGNFAGEYWVTSATPAYKLFLVDGGLSDGFLNSGSQIAINVSLSPGLYHFSIFGDGLDAPPDFSHYGLNLFFNDQTTPSISVFAPIRTSLTEPPFSANGGSTPSLSITPTIPGAGSLSFTSGSTAVVLTEYYWATPDLNGLDRVSPEGLGANGFNDWVGQFTLRVSTIPEPSSVVMLGLGTIGVCGIGLRRRRSNRASHIGANRIG